MSENSFYKEEKDLKLGNNDWEKFPQKKEKKLEIENRVWEKVSIKKKKLWNSLRHFS